MRRAKCAPHHDILVSHRRLLAVFRPPADPRRNALPARRLHGVRARGEQLPLGIPRHPDGVRCEFGARGMERGHVRQQRLRWVRDQLVRDRRAGRAIAGVLVDELEGTRGGGAGVEPGLVGDDLRGGGVADAKWAVDGGGGEGEGVILRLLGS
jgi:hypothetical protein